jgi:UDP-2,3-diacylglucosamine hydrolase
MEIMDVTPAAVDEALRASGLRLLVHGHTHRPAVHRFVLDGEPAERWVLPDWDFDSAPSRGGAIALRDGGLANVPLAG